MLTENEVGQLLEIRDVREVAVKLHNTFKQEESGFNELSLHDFLSGLLMTPSVALALVDGTTSLFEELSLNKKARRFSKGGFFLRQDPVVQMVNQMQLKYNHWGSRFLDGIDSMLKVLIPEVSVNGRKEIDQDPSGFLTVMKSSYILIRFLETFFLPEGEEITNSRRVSRLEYQEIMSIGDKLHLSQTGAFQKFMKTFEVK